MFPQVPFWSLSIPFSSSFWFLVCCSMEKAYLPWGWGSGGGGLRSMLEAWHLCLLCDAGSFLPVWPHTTPRGVRTHLSLCLQVAEGRSASWGAGRGGDHQGDPDTFDSTCEAQ